MLDLSMVLIQFMPKKADSYQKHIPAVCYLYPWAANLETAGRLLLQPIFLESLSDAHLGPARA